MEDRDKEAHLKIFDRANEHSLSKPTFSESEAIGDFRRACFIVGYRKGFLDGYTEATTRTSEQPPPNAA